MNLREILSLIKRNLIWLFGIPFCLSMLLYVYLATIDVEYLVSLKIYPSENQGISGSSLNLGVVGQLAGLTSDGRVSRDNLAREKIFSHDFLSRLINDEQTYCLKSLHSKEPESSHNEMVKALSRRMRFTTSRDTSVSSLAIQGADTYAASTCLESILKTINDEFRYMSILEAERSLSFLERELQATSYSYIKESIYSLVQENIAKKTLANVRADYVFKTLGPPEVSIDPVYPRKALITMLMFLFIFLICFSFVFLRKVYLNTFTSKD